MLLSLVLRVQSWTFSLGNTFLHISLGCLGSHTRSFQTIKNNLSCKLGGKKFAIQYVIWCLPAIEQPLGRLGWSRRLLLMMILSLRHVSNSLRPENGRGVKADVLLLPIIKRDLGIINRLAMEQQVWCVGLCGVLGGERVLGQEHLGPGHGGAVHTVAVGGTGGWARYRWSL